MVNSGVGAAAILGGSDGGLDAGGCVSWRPGGGRDLDSDRGITRSGHGRANQRNGRGRRGRGDCGSDSVARRMG